MLQEPVYLLFKVVIFNAIFSSVLLNPSFSFKLMSLVYLEDYLDTFEALPAELCRRLTQLRALDGCTHERQDEAARRVAQLLRGDERQDYDSLAALLRQTICDAQQKVELAAETCRLVDSHVARLDDDLARFEDELVTGPRPPPAVFYPEAASARTAKPAAPKRSREVAARDLASREVISRDVASRDVGSREPGRASARESNRDQNSKETGREARDARESARETKDSIREAALENSSAREVSSTDKRETTSSRRNQADSAPTSAATHPFLSIPDPLEPTYCICNQVSFGEMIACDNEDCATEWFHVSCVGLDAPVKGTWFCGACSKSNV